MFYLPTFGGVEQVMYELAKRQVEEGHEVHVYCCDSDKNSRIKVKEEIIEGVHVHRLPYIARLSLSTFLWPSLLWQFDKDNVKFDIVHTHVSGHAYILFIGILSKLKGFKHIHTTHCPWTDTFFRPKILRPFLFLNELIFNRLSFSMVDKIVPLTPWELEIINKYVNKNYENNKYIKNNENKEFNKKIKVIRNGMDGILFKKIENNEFKEKYNIKEKFIVLFFGRLNPTKGPEMLAKAAIEITKKRKDIAFLWVGPDEGKAEEVKQLIKPYSNMYYLGPIRGKEKVAEMYQSADIYVLPSYREGLPLTLFEAMASGLSIIASPVNGVPYEMKEPENGFFVSYGDIKNLEEKILYLIDNPNLRKEISKNNIKKSVNYDWDIIYKEYMNEYEGLLES